MPVPNPCKLAQMAKNSKIQKGNTNEVVIETKNKSNTEQKQIKSSSESVAKTQERTSNSSGENQTFCRNISSTTKSGVNHTVKYSKIAYNEGYRFDSLDEGEQEMTRNLYISEEAISNFILADNLMLNMSENSEWKPKLNFSCGLPLSGWYYAYVYNCKPSFNNQDNYTLQLLFTGCDVKSFVFSQSFMDPVYVGIKRDTKVGGNVFRSADYSALTGSLVMVKAINKETIRGTIFTNIVEIRFLSDTEINVLFKMIDIMKEQSANLKG